MTSFSVDCGIYRGTDNNVGSTAPRDLSGAIIWT